MEVYFSIGKGVSCGAPAHERVLPALLLIKLHPPPASVEGAGLHGVGGGAEDPHSSGLELLTGHAIEAGDSITLLFNLYKSNIFISFINCNIASGTISSCK